MNTKIFLPWIFTYSDSPKLSTEFTSFQNVHWASSLISLLGTLITSSAAPFLPCCRVFHTLTHHLLCWRVNSWASWALSALVPHALHPEHSVQHMVGDQWPCAEWTRSDFHLARAGGLSSTENVPVCWMTPQNHEDRVKYVLAWTAV